jgi:hypothetical protein
MIAAVDALGRDDGRDHSETANSRGAQYVIEIRPSVFAMQMDEIKEAHVDEH